MSKSSISGINNEQTLINSMMDVKACKLGQVSNEVADQFIHNVSHLPQLCEINLRQDSVQQGYSVVDWHKDPGKSCFNEFVRNKMAKNSLQKANPEGGHWTSDCVPGLEGQLYVVDGASKEHMLGKMLPCQLRNVIQHEICNASFSSQLVDCLTSSFGISNSPYPPDDYSMVVNDDFHTVRTNNTNDSSLFEDGTFSSSKASPSDGYNPEVATTFLAFDETSVPSSVGIGQVANEMVPSPEQISSITACSDVDVHSDTGPLDGGTIPGRQHLTESSSENYVRQTHRKEGDSNLIEHGGFLKNNQNDYSIGFPSLVGENLELAFPDSQNLQQDPQGSNNLPTGNFDIPISTCEELKPQMPESEQFYQWHWEPYLQVDEPSEVQSQDYLFEGQNASKASYIPSEKSLGVHHVASEISSILFGPTGAAKLLHSSDIRFERILLSYMNYKRTHEDGSQVAFVKHMHSTVCNEHACNCDQYFVLVSHIDDCHQWDCDICKPVRRSFVNGTPPWGYKKQEDDHLRVFSDRDFCCTSADHTEDVPPPKRLKIGNPIWSEFGFSCMVDPSESQPCEPELLPHLRWPEPPVSNDVDAMKVKMGISMSLQGSTSTSSTTAQRSNLKSAPIHPEKLIGCPKERETIPLCVSEVRNNVMDNFQNLNSCSDSLPYQESDQEKLETRNVVIALATDSGMKTKEPKILGVSLIDFFKVEEIREHLSSLRQRIGRDAKGNQMATSPGENSCQLCAMDRLVFAPTPIYCSSCGARIKRSLIYYCALDEMGTRHCFCTSCSKKSRGGEISFHGISISKEKLHKERNIHEDEESWVQCDKCKGWQHQICALYNDKRDLGGNAEYICPKCYLEGIEGGEIVPFPKTVAFGAKDLPTTLLSDHIEQRLFSCLKQEREERAKALQKNSDEVPGAADLVVRVVLSVSKLLKVKQQFLDIFQDENYPTEFPYRSNVILLFQKIEGVDVCLFGMYVQEFGSECGHPNQRSVYISYLDSVKYFRPEIKTISGEALRTFVYHEILIGYLDYCKKRGFATCYIWACPPLKGEDYILYCHPEAQKTPKSDKLRQWYKSMLRKAAKENIVVDCTNLYDNFFVPTEEHNIKITAARLPYFDGDYWSVAAIDMIKNIEQGSQVDSQGKMKKVLTKRTFKAMGHTDLSHDATKDILLMQKLGQTILPVKEDFIMVQLQFTCTICHELIQSGSRWYCNECKNFQLCARCHDMEQHLNERNICTSGSGGKHFITPVAVNYVPPDTEATDVTIDNGYFENRYSFLSFCQGNHYQFNTLRRAKHSSMMILYHLHNSIVPSVGATCSICQLDIVVNQGWHCEICPGFDACDGCYEKKGSDCHTHKLSPHASIANIGLKNGKAQQCKQIRVREVLDALLHASQCNVITSNTCSYPKCSRIRRLFHHARQCNIRVAGGCQVCQKSWRLLRLHSKNCQDSGCQVPRCMDLKKHAEMLVLQSENRRRAAVVGSLRRC